MEIKFYIKRQYGRDDMYLINCDEAKAIGKITGRKANVSGEISISHDEMNGFTDLGFRFIQVSMPIINRKE